MPKRSTQTYSSEDAPDTDAKIYVYYCKYSGNVALITDALLDSMPLRQTDNSRVIDTSKHSVRMQGELSGAKLLKRPEGKVEKQYRYSCGSLPVAYKSDPKGRYIYVMDGAVSAYSNVEEQAAEGTGAKETPPIPPCIQATKAGTVQIAVEVDDSAPRAAILRVSADEVGIQVSTEGSKSQDLGEKITEYLGKVLRLRLAQMKVEKGWSVRSKLLICEDITLEEAHRRLMAEYEDSKKHILPNYAQVAKEQKKEEQQEFLNKISRVGMHVQ